MRTCFGKGGVLLPAAAIGGAVSANAVQAAPAGLARPISSMAAAKGTTAGASTLALVKGTMKAMLPDQRSVGPAFVLAQFWPGRSHRGGANILFCDAHVDFPNQGKWIEKTDRARRRWNNAHEPHWEALR